MGLLDSLMCSVAVLSRRTAPAVLAMVLCLTDLAIAAETAAAAQANQTPPQIATAPKKPDFSKEAAVLEQFHTRIRMEADGTGTRETTARVRVLADAGVKALAVLGFTYTAANQQVDIGYVRVIKPDGTVVTTPDYNVQDMPADVTREAPMYSDIHQKHVAVKGLGVGDTLEYQVTFRTLKPEVPNQFWLEYEFEKNAIVLDEQLDLDVPADKAVTVASADVQPAVTTVNGRKLYHWVSTNLSRPDPDAPPKSTKNWKPSVQVTTFKSWEEVGAWYQSLQSGALVATPAIQARADELTKGKSSDENEVRAIYSDVALHIHYVGLDFGLGRYKPHSADDVLSNEYGDCKDKHTLLAALLKAAGFEAWPVLVSTRHDVDPAVPSPAQFDHVITLVSLGDRMLWMDSTAEVAPMGMLLAPLRDKHALVIPTHQAAYIAETPSDLPTPRSTRVQIDGRLTDHGLFTGHITESADGDVGVLLRLAFRRLPQANWKQLVQVIVAGQGFGGDATNPQVSGVEQPGDPLEFSADYTREKYYQWDDEKTSHWIGVPMPPMGAELAPGVKDKKPADDPDLGSTGQTLYAATMQLPAGWTATLPQNVEASNEWLVYRSTYSLRNGVLSAERALTVKKTKLPLGEWERYLAFRRTMFEDANRQILIAPARSALRTR